MNDLDPVLKKRILIRLNIITHAMRDHSPTANHFYRLRERLIKGQKLTKKMSENLAWVKEDVIKEYKLYSR